jgi:hypothetical protein
MMSAFPDQRSLHGCPAGQAYGEVCAIAGLAVQIPNRAHGSGCRARHWAARLTEKQFRPRPQTGQTAVRHRQTNGRTHQARKQNPLKTQAPATV